MSGNHGSYPETDRRLPHNCSDHTETREIMSELAAQLKLIAVIASILIIPSISGLAGVLTYVLYEGHKAEVQRVTTINGVSRNRNEIRRLDSVCVDLDGRVRVIERR